MNYPAGSNQVYRIEDCGEFFHYVAPSEAHAIIEHSRAGGIDRKDGDALKIELVAPDKQIRVSYSDPVDALREGIPLNHDGIAILRASRLLENLVPGPIVIGRAAEHWARTVEHGRSRQISSSVF